MSVPSLSKTTRSMPSSGTVTPSAPASALGEDASSRAAPRTKHASGGNETVTVLADLGQRRCGSLNVSSATTVGG